MWNLRSRVKQRSTSMQRGASKSTGEARCRQCLTSLGERSRLPRRLVDRPVREGLVYTRRGIHCRALQETTASSHAGSSRAAAFWKYRTSSSVYGLIAGEISDLLPSGARHILRMGRVAWEGLQTAPNAHPSHQAELAAISHRRASDTASHGDSK